MTVNIGTETKLVEFNKAMGELKEEIANAIKTQIIPTIYLWKAA